MPNQTYQTTLNIVGNIDKKLLGDIKTLIGHNAKVIIQGKEMAVSSKAGFESMTMGASMAKGAMVSLGNSIKAALLPLLGITAGVELFTKFGKSITDSIELFRTYRDQITAFKAVINESDIVQRHGYNPNRLLGDYLGNSAELAKEQGNIFMDQFYTGIQYRIVSQTSLGPQLTRQLTEALINVAGQVKGSLRNLTQEDVETYTNMVAKAYKSGQLYRLGQLLGLGKNAAKEFKDAAAAGNKELMTKILLSGTMVKISKEWIQQQINSPEGQLMKSRTEYSEQLKVLGKQWTDIWIQGQTSMYKIGIAFIPVLKDLADTILSMPIKQWTDSAVLGFERLYWFAKDKFWDMKFAWWTFTDAISNTDWVNAVESSIAVVLGITTAAIADWFDEELPKWHKKVERFLDGTRKTVADWLVQEGGNFQDWIESVTGKWSLKMENWIDKTKKELGPMLGDVLKSWDQSFVSWLDEKNKKILKFFEGIPFMAAPVAPVPFSRGTTGSWGGPAGASGAVLVGESGSEVITPVKNPGVFDDTLTETLKHTDLLSQIYNTLEMMSLGSGGPMAGSMGGSTGGGGLSDMPGAVYEQYGWEGHAANYGPHGNRLGEGYGVGLGVSKQSATGAHFGDMVRIDFADGTSMVRQVNETSERPNGVEFFTNTQGEYNRHGSAHITKLARGGIVTSAIRAILGESGPEAVIPLNQAGLSSSSIGGHFSPVFAPVIQISAGDERVAENVRDVLKHEFQYWMDEAYSSFQRKRIA